MCGGNWREFRTPAFSKLAKEANTLILPAGINDPANMVAQVGCRAVWGYPIGRYG